MAEDGDGKETKWHMGKEIPIALIATITLQSFAAIWWASGINQRVSDLERNALASVPRLEAVIRLDTKVDMLQAGMTEIKSALTALAATKQGPDRR